MFLVALKGLAGRKLRAALTAVAIVLGVAMISGTYVLTDTIKAAFSTVFTTVYAKTDAVVTGKVAFGNSNSSNNLPPSFPESLLGKVRNLPGVAEADGGISDEAHIVGRDGKVIASGGSPGLAFSVHPHGDQRFNPLTLVSGTWPVGDHEVAIDAHTASKEDFKVGQTVGVVADGPVTPYKIAGIVKIGGVSSLGGATITVFDFPTAQKIFHKEGKLDGINIAAKKGTSPTAARQRDQADPASDRGGADGGGSGGAGHQGHERLPLDHQRFPTRVRRSRPLRRHVRDREHPLDHDRAADPRARDTAHARREPPPGAHVRLARGVRDRRLRLGHRSLPRARPGEGTERALRALRDRPAAGWDGVRDADDRRRARRRHPRDAARGPATCNARHARAADLGGA